MLCYVFDVDVFCWVEMGMVRLKTMHNVYTALVQRKNFILRYRGWFLLSVELLLPPLVG